MNKLGKVNLALQLCRFFCLSVYYQKAVTIAGKLQWVTYL